MMTMALSQHLGRTNQAKESVKIGALEANIHVAYKAL